MTIESITYGVHDDDPMAIARYADGRVLAQQLKDDGQWHKLHPADASSNGRTCSEEDFRRRFPSAGTPEFPDVSALPPLKV